MPLYIHMPHTFICCPRGVHTPICPPYSSAFVCSQKLLHVVGVIRMPLHVGHPLYTSPWMGASLQLHPSTHLLASLCIGIFRGYLHHMGNISLCWGFGGMFPQLLGFFGASAQKGCLYAYSCTFL